MNKMVNLYGAKIVNMSKNKEKWRYVPKPDFIIEGEGNSCGDKLIF